MQHQNTEKSPERLAIEGALQNATKAGTSLSNEEIAEATFIPYDRVKKVTANLKQKGFLLNDKPDPKIRRARYVWAKTARDIEAFELLFEPSVVVTGPPLRNGTTTGNWVAPRWEIARPEGEDHKQFGSLRGDRVVPHAPPISMCVGKGVERFMPDRLQR